MAGTGNNGKTPKNPQNGKTKPFSTVNYKNAHLAKEKQRRQYEQQKKEKIIFALFVVIIIVLILIAVLVFSRAISRGEGQSSQTDTETPASTETKNPETSVPEEPLDNFRKEMCDKNQIYTGDLIFVDQSHAYTAPAPELSNIYSGRTKFQKGSKTVYSYYLASTAPKLEKNTLDALNKMADDFYNATGNNDLFVNHAYDNTASNDHATGLAVDLSIYTTDEKLFMLDDEQFSSDYNWIFSNYYKYGFALTSPQEQGEKYYHFRYVGIPAATYMFQNHLRLADFLTTLQEEHAFQNNKTNSISVVTEDGNYEIYYVEATGGDITSVPVPETALYFSASGDNMNGFIVTVRMG